MSHLKGDLHFHSLIKVLRGWRRGECWVEAETAVQMITSYPVIDLDVIHYVMAAL